MVHLNPIQGILPVLSNYHDLLHEHREKRMRLRPESATNKSISTLLALHTKNGQSKLVTIKKEDINFCNLFLKIFNCGKLAYTDFSLKKVTCFLQRFKWQDIKNNPEREAQNAYKAVCALANRCFRCSDLSDDSSLFNALSEEKEISGIRFKFNSEMEVCDFGSQLRRQLELYQKEHFDLRKKAIRIAMHNLSAKEKISLPTIAEIHQNSFLAISALKKLDRDNDPIDRLTVPVTRLQLNDGSLLSSHALLPKDLNTINKMQFVTPIGDEQRAKKIKDGLDRHLSPAFTIVVNER